MSGTVEGGKKAAVTNKERHGKDFYAKLGQRGRQAVANTDWFRSPAGKKHLSDVGRIGGLTTQQRKREAREVSSE